jgi:hypothetical protein
MVPVFFVCVPHGAPLVQIRVNFHFFQEPASSLLPLLIREVFTRGKIERAAPAWVFNAWSQFPADFKFSSQLLGICPGHIPGNKGPTARFIVLTGAKIIIQRSTEAVTPANVWYHVPIPIP